MIETNKVIEEENILPTDSEPIKVICGDCLEVLKKLPDNFIDACVTDPPYGLGFMGKEWDTMDKSQFGVAGNEGKNDLKIKKNFKILPRITEGKSLQDFCYQWAKEVFRVLKPGGHLLSFGGSRTYHRMAVAIEDAGFEIRDQIMWVYGSGFPKSLNIGKAVDKLQGNKREVIGYEERFGREGRKANCGFKREYVGTSGTQDLSAKKPIMLPVSKEATQYEGWGTALKPAHEPICMARKPLSEKSVAENVLKWETGGINVDGCRVGTETIMSRGSEIGKGFFSRGEVNQIHQGRFPANFIHDGSDEVVGLFPEANKGHWAQTKVIGFGNFGGGKVEYNGVGRKDDAGSAARFFYCAKASKSERNMGLDETQEPSNRPSGVAYNEHSGVHSDKKKGNYHPTVKPIKLMQYLVKLVTPKNGIVLDPFLGSGTTGIACKKLGFRFIGIEKEEDYVRIAKARLSQEVLI